MARKTSRAKQPAPRAPRQTLFKLAAAARDDAAAQARYEQARRAKYRDLFNTLLGREVLADLLASLGYFAADPPTGGELAVYRNGMRAGAAEILKAMGVDDADQLTRAIIDDDLNEVFQ